ncbi:PAXNEB-domain-containing protein [Hesseltinella vesiculosa]|uniref:Elongator complex protein 4 n=1 Tax=Hesseltinella vesiculosa TaxID=101127 RepID=A0A1X2GNM1_9FUNG|nr:PAXNEB-domain-containing protein [Hesseltinella vesiculosa]
MSFRKRNADQQPKLPSGSKLSAYNGQLLISTGAPSLDDILGGGLPVGTILVIKEDRATTYAQLLLKYFVAQGIASKQHCVLVSKDDDPVEMTRQLMWLASSEADLDDDDEHVKTKTSSDNDRMKIAWRYSHLKKFDTSVNAKPAPPPVQKPKDAHTKSNEPAPFCSLFDLTKRIPDAVLEEADLTTIDPSLDPLNNSDTDEYLDLLHRLRKIVLEGQFSSAVPVPPGTSRQALRIAIHSLASPNWQTKSPHDVCKFFQALRGLLRFSFGAAVITLPAYLYEEVPNYVRRVEHLADAVLEIESFAGSSKHNDQPYTQTYHGFFHVHKLPVLNSLLPPSTKLSVLSGGGANDLAFKLRRKRFAIETFHLPPEGGVTTRRTDPPPSKPTPQPQTSKQSAKGSFQKRPPGFGCGLPGKQDPLEF